MNMIRYIRILFLPGILIFAPEMMAMGMEDGADPYFEDPDFVDYSPGLGLFALFALIVILLLIGAGVVLGLIACALAAALVAVGTVSASAVYGLARRSAASGFRALFLSCGGIVGVTAGVCLAYVMAWIADQPLSSFTVPAIGGVIGLACGLLVAALFNFAWGRAIDIWQKSRSVKTTNS